MRAKKEMELIENVFPNVSFEYNYGDSGNIIGTENGEFFEKRKFHIGICANVLHYVEPIDWYCALNNMVKTLRVGGSLFATVESNAVEGLCHLIEMSNTQFQLDDFFIKDIGHRYITLKFKEKSMLMPWNQILGNLIKEKKNSEAIDMVQKQYWRNEYKECGPLELVSAGSVYWDEKCIVSKLKNLTPDYAEVELVDDECYTDVLRRFFKIRRID